MFCINCFHNDTRVANSRPSKKLPLVWRRRQCSKCKKSFTTHERPSLQESQKVNNASKGDVKPFNLGRLIISLAASFSHEPDKGADNALALAQTIETALLAQLKKDPGLELTSQLIAEAAYDTLKNYDEIAAMQYAARHKMITSLKKRGRPSLAWRGPRS